MKKFTGVKPHIRLNKRGVWCVNMPTRDFWSLLAPALACARALNERRVWSRNENRFVESAR